MTLVVGSRRRVFGHGIGVVLSVSGRFAIVVLEEELRPPTSVPGAQWTAREWLFDCETGDFIRQARSCREFFLR